MVNKISVVELFAGVGGFRLGLERASKCKFETVWVNQWEPNKGIGAQHAYQCYAKNFFGNNAFEEALEKTQINDGKCVLVGEDINKTKSQVPKHDLLVGGFPCQDYSVARTKAKGIEGKKGVLWWDIYDILESKKPSFVLLENVDRLLKSPTSQRGRDFGVILKCLNDLGYVVEWRVINAAEYGHPQRRRRTFIFGAKKSTPYAKSIKSKSHEEVLLSKGFFIDNFKIESNGDLSDPINLKEFGDVKKVSDKFETSFMNAGFMNSKGLVVTTKVLPKIKKPVLLEDIVSKTKGPIDGGLILTSKLDKWEYLKGAKKIERTAKNGHNYKYAEGAVAFPDYLDRPARTMLTSEGALNRSTHVILDSKEKKFRLLTPEECEAINEFPRGWTNSGMPNRWRYFMMGNALVVGVIEKLGKTLDKISD